MHRPIATFFSARRRDRTRRLLDELCRRCAASDLARPRLLVTSHGGVIREFNIVMANEHRCEMPCKSGEYGNIGSNTSVTKYVIGCDKAGAVTSAKCVMLYNKDHLREIDAVEPICYGV